jgi:hypothetical protein
MQRNVEWRVGGVRTPERGCMMNTKRSSDGITAIVRTGCGAPNGPLPRKATVSAAGGLIVAIVTVPDTTSAMPPGVLELENTIGSGRR